MEKAAFWAAFVLSSGGLVIGQLEPWQKYNRCQQSGGKQSFEFERQTVRRKNWHNATCGPQMKRILVIAAALTVFGSTAFAQSDASWWSGPEVGIQAGGVFGDVTGSGNSFPIAAPPPLTYSNNISGVIGGGHVGYNWQFNHFVLGLEAEGDAAGVSGTIHPMLGPTVYTVHDSNSWDASVTGKLGYAFSRVLLYGTGGVAVGDVNQTFSCPTCVLGGTFEHFSTIRVGWTAGAGAEYAVTPNWDIGLEYRYTDLGSKSFTCTVCDDQDHNSYTFSAAFLRISYRFAPPPPMPPAVVVPAAAPAPPPPMARTFLVFFNFDKYNLTADARKVIEAAAASYKATGSARIDVSGYTDLAGTQAYNLRLSQRRADAVAGYLANQGVPKSAMDVKWFGKEHPRVPTPDGVREPQNRRVEIVMP
jgi:opacity protein-like surface antigen